MTKLKVGVIGIGAMGINHVRVLSEIEDVELIAISDLNEEINAKLRNKYRIKTYTDYKEMLEKEKFDIVTVAVPTIQHHKTALAVLNKKINLLLEKPIATTLEEADEIIACAKENNVKLMIGHIERFNPAVLELRKKIREGELGKVYKVDVNRVGPIPGRIQDVGVTIDLAVHDIDIMRFLTDSEPERIYAETEQRIHSKQEDLLAGVIRFANKTICYLNVNWLTPTRIRKLYITGEKGMFVINYFDQNLYFYENEAINDNEIFDKIREGKMIRFKINKREPLRNEIEHFVDCVKNSKEPLVSGEDGKKALAVALKLMESAKKGEVLKYEN